MTLFLKLLNLINVMRIRRIFSTFINIIEFISKSLIVDFMLDFVFDEIEFKCERVNIEIFLKILRVI